MDLTKLQHEVGEWARKNFGERPSDDPLLGVGEEFGELCHAHLKQKQKIRTGEDHFVKIKDAVGDIVIFLCDYCHVRGISLELCVEKAWDEVQKRDWKNDPVAATPEADSE